MTLTLNTDGLRLDAALAALLPELSRSAVQRLLEDGAVMPTRWSPFMPDVAGVSPLP